MTRIIRLLELLQVLEVLSSWQILECLYGYEYDSSILKSILVYSLTLQGVVVVFWGFADWTGAGDDPEYGELYCDKVPMIAAVSILIIQKVIRKIILIASCWCAKYKPRYSEVEA